MGNSSQVASSNDELSQWTRTSVAGFLLSWTVLFAASLLWEQVKGGLNYPLVVEWELETWKTGCMPDSRGNSCLYDTIPIFCNTLKGPKNLGASLPICFSVRDFCFKGSGLEKSRKPSLPPQNAFIVCAYQLVISFCLVQQSNYPSRLITR